MESIKDADDEIDIETIGTTTDSEKMESKIYNVTATSDMVTWGKQYREKLGLHFINLFSIRLIMENLIPQAI